MNRKELTVRSVVMGLILAAVMTVANTYMALFAAMTVSAAIPAMVLAVLITRGRASIHEINIIATTASAGEAQGAGAAFTIPALVLAGVWLSFDPWQTFLIVLCGGTLGVLLMIPLRRTFIAEPDDDLGTTFPEGVAAAEMLQTIVGEKGKKALDVVWGITVGAVSAFLLHAFILIKGTVEGAIRVGSSVFYAGTNTSLILLGVGYIIGLRASLMVFAGGFFAWAIAIPLYSAALPAGSEGAALDVAWGIWSTQIRYLGVGMMAVGGIASILNIRKKIWEAIVQVVKSFRSQASGEAALHDQDMPGRQMAALGTLCAALVLGLYICNTPSVWVGFVGWLIAMVAIFFFMAVSTYIVGLIGSSSNPISGMVITTLLSAGGVMVLCGVEGNEGILATMIVASVVCVAAATAGDIAQNLMTGHIIKASPRAMQLVQLGGVLVASLVVAPTLHQLHKAYVIGEGLKAPQAVMFAELCKMMFTPDAVIPWAMMILGTVIGIILAFADAHLKKATDGKVRIYVMAVAVGVYLPIEYAVPMLAGGIICALRQRRFGQTEGADRGTMFSSGLIAGVALMATVLSVPLGFGWKGWEIYPSGAISLAVMAIAGLMLLYRAMVKD